MEQSLINLQKHENQIGNEGAKILAASLKVDQNLTWIRLFGNQICDEGAVNFADALTHKNLAISLVRNQSLTKIWLLGNNIGEKEAQTLADALKCNYGIKELQVSYNAISNCVKDDIKAILGDPKRGKQRSSLKQLETFITKKNKIILALHIKELVSKDTLLAPKDKKIASLKAELESSKNQVKELQGVWQQRMWNSIAKIKQFQTKKRKSQAKMKSSQEKMTKLSSKATESQVKAKH